VTIGTEILTSSALSALLVGIMGFMIKRWIERIEIKIDSMMEFRTLILSSMVSREAHERSVARLHERLDGHDKTLTEILQRLASAEARIRLLPEARHEDV
jgi:ABC-type transport system involved in cytochrome bd biosynthesis fused ATPase/permease subunit